MKPAHPTVTVEIEASRWREITGGWPLALPDRIFETAGCLECRETGYLGRAGIYEIMPMTAALEAHITDATDLAALRNAALREGMQPLRIAGCRKLAAGETSIEEVLGAAPLVRVE